MNSLEEQEWLLCFDFFFTFSCIQATHCRAIFPCQDTPAVKLTYYAEVDEPKSCLAKGNYNNGWIFFLVAAGMWPKIKTESIDV